MNLNALHRRLLQDVLEIGNAFPFVITGGYAVQAHHIVNRFSRDIDMATDSMVAMEAGRSPGRMTSIGGCTPRLMSMTKMKKFPEAKLVLSSRPVLWMTRSLAMRRVGARRMSGSGAGPA